MTFEPFVGYQRVNGVTSLCSEVIVFSLVAFDTPGVCKALWNDTEHVTHTLALNAAF